MKKKLLSLLALVLVLATILPGLVSCKKKVNPTESSSSSSSSDDSSSSSSSSSDDSSSGSSGGNVDPQDEEELDRPVLKYIRMEEILSDEFTFRFNVTSKYEPTYDVRYSESEITETNFATATKATEATVDEKDGYVDVTIPLTVSKTEKYYVAVKAKANDSYSKIVTLRAGGIDLITINAAGYNGNNQVYCGEMIQDTSKLFDEQELAGDPKYGNGGICSSKNSQYYHTGAQKEALGWAEKGKGVSDSRYGTNVYPIIDLQARTYVDSVWIYTGQTGYDLDVRYSLCAVDYDADDSLWDGVKSVSAGAITTNGWTEIKIDCDVQYIEFSYRDGEAPVEAVVYGYEKAEGDTKVASAQRTLTKLGEIMGVCALVDSSATNQELTCGNVVREYHNFGWVYNTPAKGTKAFGKYTKLSTPRVSNVGTWYEALNNQGINVIPCIQFTGGAQQITYYVVYDENNDRLVLDYDNEVSFEDRDTADVYSIYADMMFEYAARFGGTTSTELNSIVKNHFAATAKTGMKLITWIEPGNEPNGESNDGLTPYQAAALQSAAYDGHQSTILAEYFEEGALYEDSGYFFGAKNADPTIKVSTAGFAGIQTTYIQTMVYWMKANRTDGDIAIDAFNVHTYFPQTFVLNGQNYTTGVSPEEAYLADLVSYLVEFRDKYYPEKEVWLTEFGWDTNYSYESPTACHAYADYTAWQVQAMWLTRAYLILSTTGVDKATMYMTKDVGRDETSSGKYGTCGYVTLDGVYKDSYYYMYTLKNTLGDYTFNREISSGNQDVWVYEFINDDGKLAYAVWCPTSDGTTVKDYQLKVGDASATLVEAVDEDVDGVSSELTVTDGKVTFDVSENPVYIVLK